MGLEVSRAISASRLQIRLRQRAYLALDVSALVCIFLVSSYLTWGTLAIWTIPEVFVPVLVMTVALPTAKMTALRTETDRMRRLAKSNSYVLLAYAIYTAFVLMTRVYYSRSFVAYSFGMLMLWQVVDILLFTAGVRPHLVAVPSADAASLGLLENLRRLPNLDIRVLERPTTPRAYDGIVVDLHAPLPPEWQKFVAECAASGAQVYHAAAVYEAATGRVALSYLNERFLMELTKARPLYQRVKRVIDIAFVVLASPLLLPAFLILAILIKLDSPGPVFYLQERIGEGNIPFRMIKFRSMYVDAEADGAQVTAKDDPRITRVGRFMRRFRIDEWPQLWNVLIGEMSLIGPRPEQVVFAREYEKEIPGYSCRHLVKPGITGWAQVQHGYAAGTDDTRTKLEYDLYYIKNMSIWLDLSILIRTIGIVLTGNGAR